MNHDLITFLYVGWGIDGRAKVARAIDGRTKDVVPTYRGITEGREEKGIFQIVLPNFKMVPNLIFHASCSAFESVQRHIVPPLPHVTILIIFSSLQLIKINCFKHV